MIYWHAVCSTNYVTRYVARCLTRIFLGILLGLLLLASVGAFLLYIPLLPLAAVVVILMALVLMFTLGVQTGGGFHGKNRARLM